MFGQRVQAPLPLPSTVPAIPVQRNLGAKTVIGLGSTTVSVVFIFNLDIRVDDHAISRIVQKASSASMSPEELSASHLLNQASSGQFIQFRRVPGEAFGIALFRSAAPAARATKALTGVQLFGKEIYAQMDKRTYQLLEQWRYLRGKELGTKLASQGYEIPSNIMELVNNELNEQVLKAKGLVVETAANEELRITRFQGLSEVQILAKQEEDRIQDVLVRKAEETSQMDKANAELRALISQLRSHERQLEAIDREAEQREGESKTKRKFEMKTKSITGNPSLFELRQLVPSDRDSLFAHPIDWENIFNSSRGGGAKSNVIRTLTAWLVRKVKDYIGSYDRELVEYILRRVRLRTDPLELITDLRQYVDDEADELVKQLWSILVFETVRRQHSLSTSVIDPSVFANLILNDIPPSMSESGIVQ
jgi:hypothetical protein